MAVEYSLWGVFITCFLSATILPFPSEVVVSAVQMGTDISIYTLWIVATLGNILGAITTYLLSYNLPMDTIHKLFRVRKERVFSIKPKLDKYGHFMAFFSFVPIIGDIIVLALGYYKVSYKSVCVYLSIGKLLRYGCLIFIINIVWAK